MVGQDIEQTRIELTRRITAIEWRAAPLRIADEVRQIRVTAQASGMLPAVTVAQLLEQALVRGERAVLVHGWLGMLREAVGSQRQDPAASTAFAAACAVRFAA
jgi:hypothetical protein